MAHANAQICLEDGCNETEMFIGYYCIDHHIQGFGPYSTEEVRSWVGPWDDEDDEVE